MYQRGVGVYGDGDGGEPRTQEELDVLRDGNGYGDGFVGDGAGAEGVTNAHPYYSYQD